MLRQVFRQFVHNRYLDPLVNTDTVDGDSSSAAPVFSFNDYLELAARHSPDNAASADPPKRSRKSTGISRSLLPNPNMPLDVPQSQALAAELVRSQEAHRRPDFSVVFHQTIISGDAALATIDMQTFTEQCRVEQQSREKFAVEKQKKKRKRSAANTDAATASSGDGTVTVTKRRRRANSSAQPTSVTAHISTNFAGAHWRRVKSRTVEVGHERKRKTVPALTIRLRRIP